MKSACEYLKITEEPLVNVIYDANTGHNLVAKATIQENTPVVIYYGDIIKDGEQTTDRYLEDPDDYLANIAPYIRANADHCVDAGKLIQNPSDNLNLMGVYVNDYMKLNSLSPTDIQLYQSSQSKCNLRVGPDTRDYPVYIANRPIQSGEPLSVHYGLAYWLLQLGVYPSDIKDYFIYS